MKPLVVILFSLGSMVFPAYSQTFRNLDFESALVVVNNPTYGALDWSLAVPGWSHSSGNDTSSVYYRSPHAGLSQYYLLVDSQSSPNALLAGRYSLAFASGRSSGSDLSSPWLQA
jgi:hypothetical protein